MKRFSFFVILSIAFFATGFDRYHPEKHDEITKEQLRGFVQEAIAFARIYGKKAAIKEFMDKKGIFQRGELYIFAYDFKCRVVSHGANPNWVGNDYSRLKDPTGKLIIQEMVKIIKAGRYGWIKYKWFHPATKKITPKLGYVEQVDETWWLGSGIYLDE